MTRKRTILVLAIVALLAVGPPATSAALQDSDGLVVGSQHDSFGTDGVEPDPATLDGMSIAGSGESASITLGSGDGFYDSFEEDAADAGLPDKWESVQAYDNQNVSTDRVYTGSQSYYVEIAGSAAETRPAEQPYDTATTKNVSTAVYTLSGGSGISLYESDTRIVNVRMRNGDLQYLGPSTWNTISTVPDNNEWVWFKVHSIDPSTETFAVTWETASDSGTATGLDMRNAASNGYHESRLNTYDGRSYVDDWQVGTGPADSGTYISANHSVSNSEQIAVNITESSNVEAKITGEYYDGSSWVAANSTTVSTAANHTLELPAVSASTWRVNVSADATGDSPSFSFNDESILFSNHSPQLDDSSADSGEGRTRTLSIDASDTEFSTAQGDELDVEFFLSEPGNSTYSSVGTDTLTSNGTASTSTTADLGGEYEWYAVATDSYGASTQSSTFSFQSPGKLYIRNETDAGQLVTSTNVTVQWFGSARVYENTTDTGVIDMETLPNGDFVVQADADGYYSRTIYIKSLYQQESIYLLHENQSSVESRFRLNDPTGIFPSQTTLYIKKPIELNGTVEYRTVYADQFGTEGVTATLMEGARYRLELEAPDGTVQDMGPYRADVSETVEIRPEGAAVNIDDYSKGWGTAAAIDNQTLNVEYSDPEELTDSLTITVVERSNQSNQLRPSETYTDLGNVSLSYPLTENQSEETWLVQYEIDRDDQSYNKTVIVEKNPDLGFGMDQIWKTIFGVVALLVFAGIFSVLNVGIGAIMLGIVGGILWWTGWLAAATSGAAVIIYLFTAVVYNIYKTGGA